MKRKQDKIVLFKPYITDHAKARVLKTLNTRWIGQGPQVDTFESDFETAISHKHKAIAVNSGTSALHLSYILANIKDGDEVICPVFSCAATMIPLLYQRAKVVFADIQKDTLNIDPQSVEKLMNERVKAIVCVDYGGNPCDLSELQAIATKWNVPLIEDAAQAIGATYKKKNIGEIADFTAFSFQAIKNITTGDGGMVTVKDILLTDTAKRLRWFGIDRAAKLEDRWKNDIREVGYKYQMTDIAAAMGIEGLKELKKIVEWREVLFNVYTRRLKNVPGISLIKENTKGTSAYWLMTVFVENREALKKKLKELQIETNTVHNRCDNYSIFGGRVQSCPIMDSVEDKYLVLPLYPQLSVEDVEYVCDGIAKGW